MLVRAADRETPSLSLKQRALTISHRTPSSNRRAFACCSNARKRALVAVAFLSVAHSQATDWPQWRGSNRNGISPEKLSAHWPADGPVVLWRASVGTGFSSVSVSQGRAYTMGNTNDQETIWCFD